MKRQGKIGHLYASPAEEWFYWALSAMDHYPISKRRQQLRKMASDYFDDLVAASCRAEDRLRIAGAVINVVAAIFIVAALVAWAVLS